MRRISRKYVAITGLLAGINVLGLYWIHHDLTETPRPTARVLSLAASPHTDLADRLSLTFDRHMVQPAAVGQVEEAAVFKVAPAIKEYWL